MKKDSDQQVELLQVISTAVFEERNNNTSNNGQLCYMMNFPDQANNGQLCYMMNFPDQAYTSSTLPAIHRLSHTKSGDTKDNQNEVTLSDSPHPSAVIDTSMHMKDTNSTNIINTIDDDDEVEIIISKHVNMGTLHIDVVREAGLPYFDLETTEILASTFDQSLIKNYPDVFQHTSDNFLDSDKTCKMQANVSPISERAFPSTCSTGERQFISRSKSPGASDCKHNTQRKCLRPSRHSAEWPNTHIEKHVHFVDSPEDHPNSTKSRKRPLAGSCQKEANHENSSSVTPSKSDIDRQAEPARGCNTDVTTHGYDVQRKHAPPVGRAHVVNGHRPRVVLGSVSMIDVTLSQDFCNNSGANSVQSDARINVQSAGLYKRIENDYNSKNKIGHKNNIMHVSDDAGRKLQMENKTKRLSSHNQEKRIIQQNHNLHKDLENINNANVTTRIPGIIVLNRTPVKLCTNNEIFRQDQLAENTHRYSNIRKAKPKRKTSRKSMYQPKSEMEVFQRQIETGQLRSMISKYKTESLKSLVLKERMYEGTFAIKYKATLQNEQVVATIFIDQDVSDICVLDMAHVRHSYFVNGLKDCITGPGQSLWILHRHFPLGDLQKLLDRDVDRHVIGETHAQFIAASIFMGVEYLHKHEIVHGNIKPSKVLISKEGFPVLTGFMKVTETPDQERRDVYTLAYAAPERFRGGRDPPVDVFSVGCLAYQVVTGRTPFDGGSCEDTRANIINPAYRPGYNPYLISYAGEIFIDSCLRRNTADRFQVEVNRSSLSTVEWFSSLDLKALKKQLVKSPILNVIQLLDNRAELTCEEKLVRYDWGRVMDTTCPNKATLCG